MNDQRGEAFSSGTAASHEIFERALAESDHAGFAARRAGVVFGYLAEVLSPSCKT